MVTVTSVTPTAPTVFPLAQCDSGTGDMTLGCLATGFMPSGLKFRWTDSTGTNLTNSVQYPPVLKNNLYTGVSQITISRASWDLKGIKCMVVHTSGLGEVDFEKKVVHEQRPALKVLISSKDELEKQASFACFATNFSPSEHEITWLRNGEKIDKNIIISEIKTPSSESMRTENGTQLYNASSYLEVEAHHWMDANTKFSCVFTSMSSNNIETKNVTYSRTGDCQDTPCDDTQSKYVDIKILPLSLEDMFYNGKTEVTCEVLQKEGVIISVKWTDQNQTEIDSRGSDSSRGDKQLRTATIDVLYDEWSKGLEYYCVVVYQDEFMIEEAKNKSFVRLIGDKVQQPSLYLLSPAEQASMDTVTLTCYVKDFYPKDIFVSWLVDDVPVRSGSSKYAFDTTDPIPSRSRPQSYSAYGRLTLSYNSWRSDEVVYSCVVFHDSVIKTTRVLVRSMVEKKQDRSNIVNLSMNLPQMCKA